MPAGSPFAKVILQEEPWHDAEPALFWQTLRLFAARPPCWPWACFEDLVECLGLPRSLRPHYVRRLPAALKEAPIAPGVPCPRPVLTETGIFQTVPHRLAKGGKRSIAWTEGMADAKT